LNAFYEDVNPRFLLYRFLAVKVPINLN